MNCLEVALSDFFFGVSSGFLDSLILRTSIFFFSATVLIIFESYFSCFLTFFVGFDLSSAIFSLIDSSTNPF